jgi:aspartyl-tRNA(Asn)/glutamyl-tRNA(Gln) amidotransferase subunit A
MDRTDLCFVPATQLVRLVQKGEISPVELVEAVLGRIQDLQPKLNAFAAICFEEAMKAAREAETKVVKGARLGPLHGIPFSVKDLILTEAVRTTFGSHIFEKHLPSEDAPSVRRLKRAGAILIGKTTTPEFGHKALTDSPLFGITRNPWNLARTPGGSSGGASAAVAAGLAPLAIGSDGGGSIRIPASCTGVIGLKPTLGRVPHPQAPDLFGNLSHIGPMTRTVADAALMLQVMAGPDPGDLHSYKFIKFKYPVLDHEQAATALKGRRIAWSATLGNSEVDREVLSITENAVRVFSDFGCRVEACSPDFAPPEPLFLVLFHSSLAARLEPYLQKFREKIDPTLVDAIEKGRQYKAVDLQSAIFMRSRLFQAVQNFFRKVDFLITPTISTPALPVGHNALEPITVNDKIAGSMRGAWYPYTHPFNLTGNPAISIPCGWTSANLPVGLQIVGPWSSEAAILVAAAAFEAVRPWADKRPPV